MKKARFEYPLYALDQNHDLVECVVREWLDAETQEPTGERETFLREADGKAGEQVKEYADGTLETTHGVLLTPQLRGDWGELVIDSSA